LIIENSEKKFENFVLDNAKKLKASKLQLKNAKTTIAIWKNNAKELQEEMETIAGENAILKKENQTSGQNAKQLKASKLQLKNAKTTITIWKNNAKQLQEEMEKIVGENEILKKEGQILNENAKKLKSSKQQLQNSKMAITILNTNAKKLQEKMKTIVGENEILRKESQSSDENAKQLQEEIQIIIEENEILRKESQFSDENAKKLKSNKHQLKNAKMAITVLNTNAKELQEEIETLLGENEILRKESQASDENISMELEKPK
jgi:chromosome segregation ATPase